MNKTTVSKNTSAATAAKRSMRMKTRKVWAIACVAVAAASTASAQLTSTTTTAGGNTVVKFTGGSGTWTVPSGVTSVNVLVVGGGGGAGGVIYQTGMSVTPGANLPVTVGGGGIGGISGGAAPGSGTNSVFSSLTATGGGNGASAASSNIPARSGGSGGGGSWAGATGGSGTVGQGKNGGTHSLNDGYAGAGGGGAGAAGGNTQNAGLGGAGGVGAQYSITGSALWYGGGGGGGADVNRTNPYGGLGGAGGGGKGSDKLGGTAAAAGTANTGGGGGGGSNPGVTLNGAAGGSGVVIVSYVNPLTKLGFSAVPASPTMGESFSVTVQAQDANNYAHNVTSDTAVELSVTSGSGSLSGTTTGTISNGTSSVIISGVFYSAAGAMTLQAAVSSGMSLTLATTNLTFYSQPMVATPTFSLPAGAYVGAQTITISCGTAGSTVYYTTNGDTPTTSSQSGVAGSASATVSIPVPTNLTVKTFATYSGYLDSAVASATYTTLTGATWTNTAGGSWPTAGNWLYGVVGQGSGVTADFSTLTLPGNTAVSLDSSQTIGSLIFGDAGNAKTWTINPGSPAGTLTLDKGASAPTITVNNQTTTLGASLARTAGFIKTGAGQLSLSATNGFSGGSIVINQGVVKLNGPTTSGKGQLTGATNITVNAGGVLLTDASDAIGYTSGMEALVINGGAVTNNSNSAFSLCNPLNMVGGSLVATGTGWITITPVTQVINATSDASGNPAVISGVQVQQNANSVFSVTRGPLTPASDLNVNSILNRGGSGYLSVSGTGIMTLSGNNTYLGNSTVTTATLIMGGAGTWDNGTTTKTLALAGGAAFIYASTANQTINGAISGTGSLTQNGPGKLTLGGANSYTGATTVVAGTLALVTGTNLNDSATLTIATGGAAKVDLAAGINETVSALYFGNTQAYRGVWGSSASGATLKSDVYFSGTGTLTVTNGQAAPRGSMVSFF